MQAAAIIERISGTCACGMFLKLVTSQILHFHDLQGAEEVQRAKESLLEGLESFWAGGVI